MTEPSTLPLRPSDDLAVLERQMQTALARLDEWGEDIKGPGSYRPYLRHAQVLAWRGVAHRRPGAPREVLDHLQFAQPFIDAFLPEPAGPREKAALDFYFALSSLYLADGALEESRVEDRLADRDLSVTEREVLRVLLSNSDRYLRRGEIQRLLSFVRTPARISQILTSLDHQNLLVRMQGRAQGNPEASFFALSPRGFKVCRDLGLDRRRMPYFRLEEESWKDYLIPERIAVREGEALEPGKATAVWSYRGGVGRSTAIAQAALPLAERMREAQAGRLLVIDLDLESPGLDAHFAPGGLGECRGLRGLIVDFYKLPPSERPKWLREALLAPGYVLQPKPEEHPNLYYLPSGFGLVAQPGLDEERAEAWNQLQSEAKSRLGEAAEEGQAGPTFLSELRTALGEDLYRRALVDSHAGFGLTAWAAVLELADELVVCAGLSSRAPLPFRIVLGNFLRQRAEAGEPFSRVAFLITDASPGAEGDLNSWVEREIIQVFVTSSRYGYRTLAISGGESVDWLDLLEGEAEKRSKRWQYRDGLRRTIERITDPRMPLSKRLALAAPLTEIDPSLSRVVVEVLLNRAREDFSRIIAAKDLHDLVTGRERLSQGGEILTHHFRLTQQVALNLVAQATTAGV